MYSVQLILIYQYELVREDDNVIIEAAKPRGGITVTQRFN